MFSWFRHRSNFLSTDIHSHLIPGIDDGSPDMATSIQLIKGFEELGFQKLITTPHIIEGHYPNNPETILNGLSELKNALQSEGISMDIEAAAEYFVDEHFERKVVQQERLLTFGENLLLIETGFVNEPRQMPDLIFNLKAKGYQPVLAHPERYTYIQQNFYRLTELKQLGLKFQINAASFTGHYSVQAKKVVQFMVKNKMIDLIGSDVHRSKHIDLYKKAIGTKLFQQCRQLSLLNHAL